MGVLDAEVVERLVQKTAESSRATESLRLEMNRAARLKQENMLALRAAGLPVRGIASRLGVSPAVVQAAIAAAKRARPILDRREERVSYELHLQIALKLPEDEQQIREIGRQGIRRLQQRKRNAIAEMWLDKWQELLNAPVGELEHGLLADGEQAKEMRQLSPFAGALTQEERLIAIRKAAAVAPART